MSSALLLMGWDRRVPLELSPQAPCSLHSSFGCSSILGSYTPFWVLTHLLWVVQYFGFSHSSSGWFSILGSHTAPRGGSIFCVLTQLLWVPALAQVSSLTRDLCRCDGSTAELPACPLFPAEFIHEHLHPTALYLPSPAFNSYKVRISRPTRTKPSQ